MSSAWEIHSIPKFPKLAQDAAADIAIVGGGMAGFCVAYLLAKEGKHVILVEKGRIGQETTLYTTAFLTQSIDTSLTELESIYSKDLARDVWQSHRDAISLIEDIVKKEKINCEFETLPLHLYAESKEDLESLKEEHELAKSLGFDTRLVEKPLPNFMTEFKNVGALKIMDQAKFHPMKFFKGLAEASQKYGVEIYEKTEVTEIRGKTSFALHTKDGRTIRAKQVVVTTYDPFNNPKPAHLKKGMYESYVYSLRARHGVLPEGMYIDQKNPYHYFRVDTENQKFDRIVVGGEDHRAELTKLMKNKSFKALKEFIDKTFPKLKYTVMEKWHWGVLEPSDGLALIGEYAPGQYLATAFSGNGMTYSAIAGMIVSDLILGRKNAYTKLYDPKRPFNKKALLYKARDYATELVGGAGKNILT
ncbi:MAG: hypothetical protein JWN50_182 [Parcubacteria group bacterium]|nr:hypothetical protein [Parcubacteria group bacterium]